MNAWLQHQQLRLMRPDGKRYLRPDIGRYLATERKWEGQPRIEAGEPDGGQFTFGAQSDLSDEGRDEFSDNPVNHLEEIVVVAIRDGEGGTEGEPGENSINSSDNRHIGDNSNKYPEDAPQIPQSMPPTREARMSFVRAAAAWLLGRSAIGANAFFGLLDQVDEIARLSHMIRSANDPPASLEDLQRRARMPSEPGYENHHIVNQHSGNRAQFGDRRIDAPENVVRIPQLKHIEISRWYATKNPSFGGRSPQEVMRGISWEEQTRIGLERLRDLKVLK